MKSRILLIFQYLWGHTDEVHTVSLERLKDHLQSCGLSRPDSRTIKADIDQLIELGVFIEPQQKQLLKCQLYIDHRSKTTNESVILIVDHLHTAIIERKKVTF